MSVLAQLNSLRLMVSFTECVKLSIIPTLFNAGTGPQAKI